MKRAAIVLFLLLFFISPLAAFANSSYILPYPSAMPGSKLYKVHVLLGKLEKYWYFGDFGQFTYNLKESDEYLVQAKTLLDYGQYLLASQALEQSNTYFSKIPGTLGSAKKHEKDISEKEALFHSAAQKHTEVLRMLIQSTPETIHWSPEKSMTSDIQLHKLLINAIHIQNQL